MLSARFSGMPLAMRWRGSQFHTPTSQTDVEEEKETDHEQQRAAKDGGDPGENKARSAGWRRHMRKTLHGQRGNSERGNRVAKAAPVALEEIGGNKWRGKAAEAEKEIHEVQCCGSMRLTHAAHQCVGSSDDDAAADAEEEKQNHNPAEPLRTRQQEERKRDARQAEDEAYLVTFAIEQRAYRKRGDHQPQSLCEGDGAVLRWRQAEAIRQLRKDCAQHRGDHSVDKDGQDGAENQHRSQSFQGTRSKLQQRGRLRQGKARRVR